MDSIKAYISFLEEQPTNTQIFYIAGFIFSLFLVYVFVKVIAKTMHNLKLENEFEEQYDKTTKSYIDPNANDVKDQLVGLSALSIMDWPTYLVNKEKINREADTYISILEGKKNKTFKENDRSLIYIYKHKTEWQASIDKEVALDKIIESQNKIKSLIKENTKLENSKKEGYYKNNVKDQTYISLIHNEELWEKAHSLYKDVQEEINEAQSALSSAQFTETMDLFSKNKGISIISSISNSSASSEVKDIKPAMQKLMDHMKEIQSESEDIQAQIRNFNDNTDIMVDLLFDFSFDFTSIFSLSALSSASNDVDEFEQKINPLGNKIQSKYSEASKARDDYFRKLP